MFIRLESPRCSYLIPFVCQGFRKLGVSTDLKLSLIPEHATSVANIRIKQHSPRYGPFVFYPLN